MRKRRKLKTLRGFFYVHDVYDPFSKYINSSVLKRMKIDRVVHESAIQLSPQEKRKAARAYTNVAKNFPRTIKKFLFVIKRSPDFKKEQREYELAYLRMLKGSGVKSTVEPGVPKHEYLHLFPRYFREYFRDEERTKKLLDHLKRYMSRGERIAIFHGLAHANLIIKEAKERNIPFRSYILGGVPVFQKGTPLMIPPRMEAYTRYEYGKMNRELLGKLQIRGELSAKAAYEIIRKYPEFQKHPTAAYFVGVFVADRILSQMPRLSSIEFEERLNRYLSSQEFRSLISRNNMILYGSLLPKKKK